MRKILIPFFILLLASCMDADFENQDLCTYVICGETIQEKVNITVYNNTTVDFEQVIWSISGQVDTINVLAFDQFSCWVNYDTIQTDYLFAHGFSSGTDYLSDTLFFDREDVETITEGDFLIRVALESNQKLLFALEEDYSGECISIR